MPGDPGFGEDRECAVLEYIDDAGCSVREELPAVPGDYGRVYDALYDTLSSGKANYVSEQEALTNLDILQKAFQQPTPAIVSLEEEA